jgi:hypothetical protein
MRLVDFFGALLVVAKVSFRQNAKLGDGLLSTHFGRSRFQKADFHN